MGRSFLFNCFILVIAGLALGLSAPGIGVWITAWFCLAPLLFYVGLEQSLFKTFVYGFLFGLAYNCIYWQWLLNLAPLDWLGFSATEGQIMSWAALLLVSSHQALIIAIFALIYRIVFCSRMLTFPGWFGTWLHTIIVPFGWILIINKIGNAHNFIGVPWSMLEYSQYKNLFLIQVADIIGGIGIAFLLVMVNTLIAKITMRFVIEAWKKEAVPAKVRFVGAGMNPRPSIQALMHVLPAAIFIGAALYLVQTYGHKCFDNWHLQPTQSISIVQPNINIEMYKSEKKYSIDQLLNLEIGLSQKCPPGLCLWTEGAVPTILSKKNNILLQLQKMCADKNLSLVTGTVDQDNHGNFYNAAIAIANNNDFYHKRYLVPFGEYAPDFVDKLPYSQTIRTLTNTPAGAGYSCGEKAVVLKVQNQKIAPLICFEVISPELTTASVRAGGQLLVNINDLSWFHKSIIGEQMIACAVFRAIENRRYCIFAGNTGPSAIISPLGQIQCQIGQNIPAVLTGKFEYRSNLTVFTQWFVI
jgi:apolipoprotein N-acyltransferase